MRTIAKFLAFLFILYVLGMVILSILPTLTS